VATPAWIHSCQVCIWEGYGGGREYGAVEAERSPRTPVEFPEVDTVDVGFACFRFGWRAAHPCMKSGSGR